MQTLGGAWSESLAKYDAFKAVSNVAAVHSYLKLKPKGLAIHRTYYSDSEQSRRLSSSVVGAVAQWMTENDAALVSLPGALHEGFNEAGLTPRNVAYETERVLQMGRRGYRACVLNLAVGTYNSDSDWERADVLQLARLVESNNGAIGLHCYGEGVISSNCGSAFWKQNGDWSGADPFLKGFSFSDCWLACRIGRVREILDKHNLHPQLIATELAPSDDNSSGVPAPFGQKVRGWKDCIDIWRRMGWLVGTTPEAFYIKQLQWWTEVTGCVGLVYAWNDTTTGNIVKQPGTFDVQGVL